MSEHPTPVYLDCNATSPLSAAAREAMLPWLDAARPANAGSRTHGYGSAALKAVNLARRQVGDIAAFPPSGVVFTSGATEANNLAILGLARQGNASGRRHIVTSAIEHKAVLEPVERLEREGFEVTRVAPDALGTVAARDVLSAVREDTLLVSLMQVNNETGMCQPIEAVADGVRDRLALFHVDAAQGFGKSLEPLRHPRLDLIAVSAHKIGGPGGVGALLYRKRDYVAPPLEPLIVGGGQENNYRAGTLPTMLIAGFGAAAHAMLEHNTTWRTRCERYRTTLLAGLGDRLPGELVLNMEPDSALPNCINLGIRDTRGRWIDGEALLLALKGVIAASNGSACTSNGMEPSHVLRAQGLPADRVRGAIRLSWTGDTAPIDWTEAHRAMRMLC